MLERAIYLRKAIDAFTKEDDKFERLVMEKREWEMCELLCALLLPFKKTSDRLEQTSRPGIYKVFWSYETLFNEIDRLKAKLRKSRSYSRPWVDALQSAIEALATKLRKYYKKTGNPFAYADGVLLNPRSKGTLFKQQSWEPEYAEKYNRECRERYVNEYESMIPAEVTPSIGNKRKRDDDDDDDEYEMFLERHTATSVQNEYDRYISEPMPRSKIDPLVWWKAHALGYPRLSRMARDILAVPATGAGVEREFSKARRVTAWYRARLNASTITKSMMYKNHLFRQGKEVKVFDSAGVSLVEEEEWDERDIPQEWRDQWWLDIMN
jgi:hypothetical protein